MKKITLIVFSLIVLSFAFVFLIYSYLYDERIQSLIIPEKLAQATFDYQIVGRTSDEKTLSYFRSIYTYNTQDRYYYLKSNLTENQKNDLRLKLKNAGYYGEVSGTDRDIDTSAKFLLNGTLGQFFRFKLLGNINWLIIPLGIYFLATIKKRQRWEIVVFIFYIIGSILLLQGAYNYRYQLTLVPITVFSVFYLLDEITNFRQVKPAKYVILGSVFMLVMLNLYKSYASLKDENQKYISTGTSVTSPVAIESNSKLSPLEMTMNFINSLPVGSNDWFLVNNLPEFYYYSNKSGYYCWFFDNICYRNQGILIFDDPENKKISNFLSYGGKIKYIISTETFNKYNAKALDFIKKNTKLIFKSGEYVVYEVK